VKYVLKLVEHWKENALLRRIIRNASYLLSSNVVIMALSMLQGAIAARILGVEGIGYLGAITAFATVINRLTSFRMGELVIKYVGQHQENGDSARAAAVFKLAAIGEILVSLLAFLLIWLIAPLWASYLEGYGNLTSLFVIYGFTVLANLITESSTGLLQLFDRFRRIAVVNVIQSIVTLSLVTLTWLLGGNLMNVLLAYLVGKIVNAFGLSLAALVQAGRAWGLGWWKVPLGTLRQQFRELAKFAVNTNLSSSLTSVNKSDTEIFIVSLFVPPIQAGYYKITLALANVLHIPVMPLPQSTYPELSRAATKRNWKEMRYILRQGSRLAGAYSFLAGLALIILGRFLIQTIYTPEFLPAYDGLVILTVGIFIANTFYWARTSLLSMGLPHVPTIVNLILAIFKLTGMIILLPKLGYVGAAMMLAINFALGNSTLAIKARAEIKRQEQIDAQTAA
jgi:O-antigen/teichoic acid export membrane protein